MYPEETPEARGRRLEHLLDLYLNMPNRGHCDTPLHQVLNRSPTATIFITSQLFSPV